MSKATTIDAKDERLTGTHYASEAAAKDLPTKVRKIRFASASKPGESIRHLRVRLSIPATGLSDEAVRELIESAFGLGAVKVTRVREVI